jgi:hypothetical protein
MSTAQNVLAPITSVPGGSNPALAGGAALLPGFLSAYGAYESNQANIDWQKEYAQNNLNWLLQQAEQNGINPLAVLGHSAGSPSAIVGSKGAAAQSLGKALSDWQKQKLVERDDLEKQFMSSRTRLNNAQAAKLEGQADIVKQQASASAEKRGNIKENAVKDTIVMPRGEHTTSATHPQETVENQYGGIVGETYGIYRYINDLVGNAFDELLESKEYYKSRNKRKLTRRGYR